MRILASSSSVPALLAGGLAPDFIISTDGGGWALFHLYECLRVRRQVPLAVPFCAALPSQCAALPVIPVCDGSLWQTIVLSGCGIPFISLAQRGTVTASALDLAFVLSSGPVYISGMDLANRDISTHARPYRLSSAEENASRLDPLYSRQYRRASAGGSMNIYAEWFGARLDSYPKRLFSLGKNHPVFDSIPEADFSDTSDTSDTSDEDCVPEKTEKMKDPGLPIKKINVINDNETLVKKALEILLNSLDRSEFSTPLQRELGDLLFPDDGSFTAGQLREKLILSAKVKLPVQNGEPVLASAAKEGGHG
jgi:hypothetical protein